VPVTVLSSRGIGTFAEEPIQTTAGARGPEDARCCRAAAAWRRFRCSSGRPNRLGCSQTEVRVRASTALERAQTAAAWLC